MNVTGTALEGLKRAESQLETAAGRIARLPAAAEPTPEADSVSLSDELVQLIEAKNNFKANLKVLQTADEIQQHTLDILA